MLKDKTKGLIAGVLIGAVVTGGTVFARQGSEMIEALYSDIKIYIDGVQAELKDANGTTVEPFIYNGTTYLPVRGVAQAMGSQVEWDGPSNSVYLWDKLSPDGIYLVEELDYYEKDYDIKVASSSDGSSFEMMGEKYSNGIYGEYGNIKNIKYNLNSKYSSMTFTMGHMDGHSEQEDASVTIVVDGNTVQTFELQPEEAPRQVTVPLNKGLQLKIMIEGRVGMADIILE